MQHAINMLSQVYRVQKPSGKLRLDQTFPFSPGQIRSQTSQVKLFFCSRNKDPKWISNHPIFKPSECKH